MKRTKKITILLCILIHDIILIPNDSCSRTLRYTPSGHSGRAVQNTKLSYFNKLLTHFSYIKYFAISIYFLSRLHKKNYRYKPCNAFEQKDYIQIDTAFFFHNKTKSCLHNVLYTKSLKPIIALLQETYDHLNIQDHNFIHEIFLLIFTVHKQILLQECKEHHHVLKKATLTTIIEVSDKINQLPIAEVLSA